MERTWTELAVFAYRSYLEHGRGVVLLSGEMAYVCDIEERFSNDDICEKISLRSHVSDYDPSREVVVCFASGSVLLSSQRIWAGAGFTPPVLYHASLQGPALEWQEEATQIRSFRWTQRRRLRKARHMAD